MPNVKTPFAHPKRSSTPGALQPNDHQEENGDREEQVQGVLECRGCLGPQSRGCSDSQK